MPSPKTIALPGKESSQQRALFCWSAMATNFGLDAANDMLSYTVAGKALSYNKANLLPQLKWLHMVNNQGHGDAIRGAKAKAEGVKAGVWDIFLPVSCPTSNGLYIEMKVKPNVLSDVQLEFERHCIDNSYYTNVCYSWQEARDAILKYLGLS